jgi:hypothetical protein
MKKTIVIVVLAFLAFKPPSFAQNIQNQVVASSGERMEQGGTSLDFTVGETVVDFYDQTNDLHQGFHQVYNNVIITSVTTPSWAEDIKVYPNPTSGLLNIDVPGSVQPKRYQVVDIGGKEVFRTDAIDNTLNLSALSQGTYFLRIFGEKDFATYQIIKTR